MKLEKIQELWSEDCHIDRSQLDLESLKIPLLHEKYYKILIQEQLRLKKMTLELSSLKHDKEEFYVDGPNEYTPKDWVFPSRGRIMRGARPDLDSYMNKDLQIQQAVLETSLQQEKVKFLESILHTVNQRSFAIKNAMEFLKFTQGQ